MNFNLNQSEYFDHPYNNKIKNERTIEIPIALRYFEKFGKLNNFIEIGAVLPYYLKDCNHCCIDPVDPKATNLQYAENIDYLNKHILSISTIEHINTNDYGIKIKSEFTAYDILRDIYKKSLTCLISWPIGYNPQLDNDVLASTQFNSVYFEKIEDNNWIIVEKKEMYKIKYNYPYEFGNGLIWVYKM